MQRETVDKYLYMNHDGVLEAKSPWHLYISINWSVIFIVTTLLLSHFIRHIIYLFSTSSFLFFFLTFLLPILKRRRKKKTLILPICPHLLLHFPQPFPFLFTSLFPHYFLLYRYNFFIFFPFLYFDSSFSYFILYKSNIISLIQSIFFSQKVKSTLSLSLDFSSFL